MIDEKHGNLAKNFRNLHIARNLSLMEFSKALDIPKSTLQAILEDGQTTLHELLACLPKRNETCIGIQYARIGIEYEW